MWAEIMKHVSEYDSLVLTTVDAAGFPYSVRCQGRPDDERQILVLVGFAGQAVQAGPASVMAHYHNEQLWDLKSFLLRGRLEHGEDGWLFYPVKLVAQFVENPVELFKNMFKTRKVVKRYLEKRGLERPKIPWDEYKKLRAESKIG